MAITLFWCIFCTVMPTFLTAFNIMMQRCKTACSTAGGYLLLAGFVPERWRILTAVTRRSSTLGSSYQAFIWPFLMLIIMNMGISRMPTPSLDKNSHRSKWDLTTKAPPLAGASMESFVGIYSVPRSTRIWVDPLVLPPESRYRCKRMAIQGRLLIMAS